MPDYSGFNGCVLVAYAPDREDIAKRVVTDLISSGIKVVTYKEGDWGQFKLFLNNQEVNVWNISFWGIITEIIQRSRKVLAFVSPGALRTRAIEGICVRADDLLNNGSFKVLPIVAEEGEELPDWIAGIIPGVINEENYSQSFQKLLAVLGKK